MATQLNSNYTFILASSPYSITDVLGTLYFSPPYL